VKGKSERAASIAERLEAWFAKEQRELPWRVDYDPYSVWVSEVMLQQTRVDVVVPYFERFLADLPTVAALAGAEEGRVLTLWSGLGYYRRARMLQQGARYVMERHGGVIPSDEGELRKIPGIGRYTAGAIASIAFQRRAAIVDGNVARVAARLERLGGPAASPELLAGAWKFAGELVEGCASSRALNQALMELGALICKPRGPLCGECPLRDDCEAFAAGVPESFPAPRVKRTVTQIAIPLLVVLDAAGRVLLRRASGELMNGMYHLPHGSEGLLGRTGGTWRSLRRLGSFRHTVTFRSILFHVEEAEAGDSIADGSDEWLWADESQLREIPLPSYVRKAMKIVKNEKMKK
jgi:A/G-specific adenine glycosylase